MIPGDEEGEVRKLPHRLRDENGKNRMEGVEEKISRNAARPGLSIVIFISGLLILIGSSAFFCRAGYEGGIRNPGCVPGNPLGLLTPVFALLALSSLFRMSRNWGIKPVAGSVLGYVVFLGLTGLFLHIGADIYGKSKGFGELNRERFEMRRVGKALESHRADTGAYPLSLDALSSSTTYALHDGFDLRYDLGDQDPISTLQSWILWLPGPDRKWDIYRGPELRDALKEMAEGRESAWIANHSYDATNGTSTGDMVHISDIKRTGSLGDSESGEDASAQTP